MLGVRGPYYIFDSLSIKSGFPVFPAHFHRQARRAFLSSEENLEGGGEVWPFGSDRFIPAGFGVLRLGNRRKIYGLARRIRSNIGYTRLGKVLGKEGIKCLFWPANFCRPLDMVTLSNFPSAGFFQTFQGREKGGRDISRGEEFLDEKFFCMAGMTVSCLIDTHL
jgi:hypothetical protein